MLALIAVCNPAQAQNSPATGMPAVTYATGVTVPTEDSAITAAQGTIADTDGLGTLSWQWSQADANGGTYTPVQAVPPTSDDSSVDVLITATSANPYIFKIEDFPYRDADGEALSRIRLRTTVASGKGSLRYQGLAVVGEQSILVSLISTLTYYPPANTPATAAFASFRFRVADDGLPPETSDAIYTMTINIVDPAQQQTPASGAPTVTATDSMATAWNEDVTLTAAIDGVTDANGINTGTIMWRWQQAAAADGGAALAEGAWADIDDATATTFTPTAGPGGHVMCGYAHLSWTTSRHPPKRPDAPQAMPSPMSMMRPPVAMPL